MKNFDYFFLSQWADRLQLMLFGTGCLIMSGYAYVFYSESGYNTLFSLCYAVVVFVITAAICFISCAIFGIVLHFFDK